MKVEKTGKYLVLKDFSTRSARCAGSISAGTVLEITQIDKMGKKVYCPNFKDWKPWDLPVRPIIPEQKVNRKTGNSTVNHQEKKEYADDLLKDCQYKKLEAENKRLVEVLQETHTFLDCNFPCIESVENEFLALMQKLKQSLPEAEGKEE